jgi:hypothetical protein
MTPDPLERRDSSRAMPPVLERVHRAVGHDAPPTERTLHPIDPNATQGECASVSAWTWELRM